MFEFSHKPVLYDEVIENLNIKPDGIYVDCTTGGAGHSSGILQKLDTGRLICIDQDAEALNVAESRLSQYGKNVEYVHGNFDNLTAYLNNLNIESVDGILADLGVSSYQFDNGERGFSYNTDARLDMRMNQEDALSAYEVVNSYSQKDLEDIIFEYGEERWAKRIAEFIIMNRKIKPIETTFELVSAIKAAIPKSVRFEGAHPAKKTFQAIRIEVNSELDRIYKLISSSIDSMASGARLCIITFHSLEDRIVKNEFKRFSLSCICPSSAPICTCKTEKKLEIITRKPIIASDRELEENNRARSAKLRVGMRL